MGKIFFTNLWLAAYLLVGVFSIETCAQDLFIQPLFQSARTEVDQVYRTDALRIDGTRSVLLYDVFRPIPFQNGPAVPDSLPGMILIHGGGFRNGSKNNANIAQTAHYFASRGYVVSTINYRLIDDSNPLNDPAVETGPWPVSPPSQPALYVQWANNPDNDNLRQANAANAAHNDASIFANFAFAGNVWPDVDTSRIVMMGSSAGAITSLLTGYSDLPNGPTEDLGAVVSLAGGFYQTEYVIDGDDPPLWFQHGTNDPVVEFSNAIAIQLRAEEVNLPYSFHSHQQGHSTTGAYFNEETPEGLTFAENSVRFLYSQMSLAELAGIILGDVNLDGRVDLLDVAPFVELIFTGGFQKQADINQDGVLDLLDINGFIEILAN